MKKKSPLHLIYIHKYKPCSDEKGHSASAKSVDPDQPAQNAQPHLGSNFFVFSQFSACQRSRWLSNQEVE